MKNLSLLVMAAGMGSRYGGLKQLDQVGPNGETIIDYSVYDAIKAGFTKVVFIIRKDFEDQFKSQITEKYSEKIDIAFAFQNTLEVLCITMSVRTVDSSQYQARMLNYDFDMIKASWNVSLSPGNEQQFYWGSEVGKKDGSKNYAGVNSPVVDSLIETLIGAKTREELTTAIHALDRVLLWGHYVIPLYHSNTDRIAYWNFLEFPDEIPLYGLVIESWWANSEKASKLQR